VLRLPSLNHEIAAYEAMTLSVKTPMAWAGRVAVRSLCALIVAALSGGFYTARASESEDNLLALTWQPAFCEYRPNKPECIRLNAGQLPVAARQLSLHGLWPQPKGNDYCGVLAADRALDENGDWADLPDPGVDAATEAELKTAMPGTASFLHRHEWVKHGTCYRAAGGGDEYFDDALRLMEEINRSAVGAFLADRVGREVATRDIREKFDAAFGPGTGERVAFTCRKDGERLLIREVRIGLRGVIATDAALGDLIRAAAAVPIGCGRGIVDPAGLQ